MKIEKRGVFFDIKKIAKAQRTHTTTVGIILNLMPYLLFER